MGADNHPTKRPTNWDEVVDGKDELPASEYDFEVEFIGDGAFENEYERLYQLYLSPVCASEGVVEYLPTFIYFKAVDEEEAWFKAELAGSMLHDVECTCQINIAPVELYV